MGGYVSLGVGGKECDRCAGRGLILLRPPVLCTSNLTEGDYGGTFYIRSISCYN